MNAAAIIRYVEIGLACLAGLWGLICLFRNMAPAWRWIALAALVWALTFCLQAFLPAIWDTVFLKTRIFHIIQNVGIGLCLFIGLLSAK